MVPTILITRPEPAATEFANMVRQRIGEDVPILVSPLMQTEYAHAPIEKITDYKTLLFTSRHAVAALSTLHQSRDFQCYCVGGATTEAARAAGFNARDGGGTVDAMLGRIIADNPSTPCLYLRGEHIAADLVQALRSAEIETDQRIMYCQRRLPPSPDATHLLRGTGPIVAPIFSARSAKLLFAEVILAPVYVVAISRAVPTAVPPTAVAGIHIAATPTAAAVLDLIEEFFCSANRLEGGNPPQ